MFIFSKNDVCFQTEEERELMMQLLHGKPKEEKPKKEEPKKSNPGPKLRPNIQRPKESSSEAAEIEVEPANDEVDMIDSLVCEFTNIYC